MTRKTTDAGWPSSPRPLLTVASTAPPITALLTRPRPPNSDVPPITAAPTANSSVLPPPELGETDPTFDE